jgi:HAD superfamily hydrolase (TIGR01549 family)
MIRGVLFDLGSTLIYSEHDHQWGAILPRMRQDVLRHLEAAGYRLDGPAFLDRLAANIADFDRQRQTDWVEYTTSYLLKKTLDELGAPPPSAQVLADAVQSYYAYSEGLWRTMPGAHETLTTLADAGLRLGIISNAGDDGNVQRLIDNAGLRRHFDPILVSAAVGLRKPNPRIFAMALEVWGLAPAECVMVGDTLGADILGAQMTGLRHVWLTAHADHAANRGHRGQIVPEAEVAALPELLPLLRGWGAPLTA